MTAYQLSKCPNGVAGAAPFAESHRSSAAPLWLHDRSEYGRHSGHLHLGGNARANSVAADEITTIRRPLLHQGQTFCPTCAGCNEGTAKQDSVDPFFRPCS